MSNIKCIDVSTWQGSIDWKKVKAAGYEHAIIRAGYGREASQVDNRFEQNYKNARAAGVKVGVYWYSYAVDKADAIKEANACLQVLGGRALDMPVYFDMEESSMTKLGKTKLTEMAKAFCDTIKKGGYTPGVYSNPTWFNNYLDYKGLKKLYSIWLAQYYKEAQYECDVWQYASDGKVSGISGKVDMNIIYNEGIIKKTTSSSASATTTKTTTYETALLQALLRQAYAQGLCKTFVKPIDNKKGALTNAAVIECRTSLGYKNPDSTIDLEFITELEHQINVVRIGKETELKAQLKAEQAEPAGDFNGDGVVNIKDATAIQKHIAGLD